MKSACSLLLILCLLAALLSGCGGTEPAAQTETPSPAETSAPTATTEPTEAPETTETPEPTPLPEASEIFNFEAAYAAYAPDTVVLRCGGTEINWKMYYGAMEQVLFEINTYYGISDLNTLLQEDLTVADWLRGWTEAYLTQMAVLHERSAAAGVELSEEELGAIDEDIRAQADTYFEGDVDALFAELHVPEALYRYQAESSLLYDKLYIHFFGENGEALSDEDAAAYAADQGFLYVKHILLSYLDENGVELSEEEKEAKREQALALLEELRAAAPEALEALFDRLMAEHSEDPGLAAYPDGYYFQSGDMVKSFEDASVALEEGALSDAVESDYGVHLIYRPAMRGDHLMGYDSSYQGYSLREYASHGLFDKMFEDWTEQLTPEYAPGFEDLDLVALFSFDS